MIIDSWHASIAEVPSVSMVLVVQVSHVILLTIVVLPGHASVDPLVHGGTLESLLWSVSLRLLT